MSKFKNLTQVLSLHTRAAIFKIRSALIPPTPLGKCSYLNKFQIHTQVGTDNYFAMLMVKTFSNFILGKKSVTNKSFCYT